MKLETLAFGVSTPFFCLSWPYPLLRQRPLHPLKPLYFPYIPYPDSHSNENLTKIQTSPSRPLSTQYLLNIYGYSADKIEPSEFHPYIEYEYQWKAMIYIKKIN